MNRLPYHITILVMLLSMVATSICAVEINGVNYKLDKTNKTASVIAKETGTYSGDIVIDYSCKYDGVYYTITGIANQAFANCTGLTSISIPNSVTSIEKGAFSGCPALTEVNLNCNEVVNKAYTSGASLKDIFGSQVKKYTLGDEVTGIGDYAFSNYPNLQEINISNRVVVIGNYAFTGSIGLTSVSIPDGVWSMGEGVFQGCTGLETVNIPSGIYSIESKTFAGCSSLVSITIPYGVMQIGGAAFSDCINLTTVSIPQATTIGGSAFSACSNLTTVSIPNANTIGSCAFADCTSLTSVNFSNSMKRIETGAFRNCTGIKEVTINSHALASASYYSGNSLNEFFGGQVETFILGDEVKVIGSYAFAGCSAMTSITLPQYLVRISDGAFADCTSLTTIEIPNSVTSIGYSAFYGTKIHELTIPTSVEICSLSKMDKLEVLRIEDSEEPMDLELYSLNLKYLYLGRNISADNFSHLKDLCSELEIGEKVTEICDNEPSGRMGIGTINIHNGIKTIGKNAFYNTYLNNVVLPPSVERIGWRGLYVYGLENLTLYTKNPPQVAENCFYEPSECTMYVPKGCIDNYKNNEKWKGFKEYKEIDNYLWEPR